MFNLEQSIAEWRQKMLAAGIKTPVPLEELECHLREEIEQQIKSGMSQQQAFEMAVRQVGCSGALDAEFKKVDGVWEVFQRKSAWLLMAVAFAGCWIKFGQSPAVGVAYGILLAGLIIATFVDFAHFIIPDRITLGGVLAGLLCSFLLPQLHEQKLLSFGLLQGLLGMSVGAGTLYAILRVGKLAFGKQQLRLADNARIIFTEDALLLPDKAISYAEMFYRKSDAVTFHAQTVELAGRSYSEVPVRLTTNSLRIGNDQFRPEDVTHLEATSKEIILPREAMGMGDVKLMAAIGAFLGWQAVVFTLVASSVVGALVGFGLITARRRQWSAKIPYGPYLALAAVIWIFAGKQLLTFLAP